jgi:HEAT repeat protein/type 1 glutamine amidotransferase
MMNRRISIRVVLLVFALHLGLAEYISPAAGAEPLKALIVNGQMNQWHNWKVSSPILQQLLKETGLFDVDTATVSSKEDVDDFKPEFAAYDVVVLDYDGPYWPEETKKAFVEYVSKGGGVVVYHSADNAFPKWSQYNEIIGLGGWGERNERSGPMVRWRDGKVVLDESPGKAGSHPPKHQFQVVIRNHEHPITAGLPEKWMHAPDELYGQLRGPAKNLTVLATAYSDPAQEAGTGEHEPVLFTLEYGQGRIFHTVLGHVGADDDHGVPTMNCVGFITTLQRGAEWAATGNVTQKIPQDFPTANEVCVRKGPKSPQSLDELLGKISTYEFGQSRTNLTELADFIRTAGDEPPRLKSTEQRLLEFLRSDATLASKQFVCKKLSVIASEQAVPTLAKMLTDDKTSDMARYALERTPGEAVDKTLVKALTKTKGKVKVGIINSLGERGSTLASSPLSKLLNDKDNEVAQAAAAALGKIADPTGAKELGKALATSRGYLHTLLADSYLMCADKFAASGKRDEAIAIYRELYAAKQSTPIRLAALAGIVTTTRQDEATKLVVSAFKDKEPAVRATAISLVKEIEGTEIVEAAVAQLPNLSTDQQVQMLSVLGETGNPAALPIIIQATGVKAEPVRIAAMKALASFGNASTVVLLAQAAATTDGTERQAARESLYRLRGPEVNRAIRGGINKAEPEVKVELIRSLSRRNVEGGAAILLTTAQNPDQRVKLESIKVLREIADAQQVPQLVKLLTRAETETERKEIEKTLGAAVRKNVEEAEKADVSPVLSSLARTDRTEVRCSLLQVLGAVGSSAGLGPLREALGDENEAVKTAAIRALGDWPNDGPAEDLLKIVQHFDNETQRALAFRGYVRLAGLVSDRPTGETIKMYRVAMDAASDASEKKMVLSGLAEVKSFAALYMAYGYLEDESLQAEAAAAIIEIAEFTIKTHPQQTKIILREVIRASANESVREEAEQILKEIE